MSENLNEQSVVNTAEQSAKVGEATSLGRFKDAPSLLEAYNNLEKEFTKRSQKLKVLERNVSEPSEMIKRIGEVNQDLGELLEAHIGSFGVQENGATTPTEQLISGALNGRVLPKDKEKESDFIMKYLDNNIEIKEKLLAEYLDKLPAKSLPKLNKNRGITVLTPPRRPKNIAEAGRMAENILMNRSK